MRVDGVAPYDRMFPTHEVTSKVVGHRNNHMMTDVLKVHIESVREGEQGIASPIECKSCEETDTALYSSSPRLHSYADIEDSIKSDQNEGEHTKGRYSLPIGQIGPVEKEAVSYTEKNVTEIELPEMIAGFTNGTCTIKDICIDEGVHFLETVLVEGNEDQEVSSRFNQTGSNGNYDMTEGMTDSSKGMTGSTSPDSHGLKSSSVNEYVDTTEAMTDNVEGMTSSTGPDSHGLKSSSVNEHVDNGNTEQGKLNEVNPFVEMSSEKQLIPFQVFETDPWQEVNPFVETSSEKQLIPLQVFETDPWQEVNPFVETSSEKLMIPLQLFDTDPWQADTSSFDVINDHKQYMDHQKNGQDRMEERNSTTIAVPSTDKESNQSNGTSGSPANGEVESGVITFNFDSGATTVSGREESKENLDNRQSGQARYVLKSEEATHEGATNSARSSFVQHGYGDSSLFGSAYLSGTLVSSGHIPYSGSISHRSDSSTTSARSFAFPVLQSEWNSSPVKMAKAERRRFGKHRGWRMGLLCCRF